MKIRRYEARTEYEAIEKAKNDLGKNAVILNIKKINPKGSSKLFKKPSVEVTAALDEQLSKSKNLNQKNALDFKNIIQDKIDNQPVVSGDSSKNVINNQKETIKSLENKLDHLEELFKKAVEGITSTDQRQKTSFKDINRKYNNTVLQLFYDNLINNEVLPELAETILNDLDEEHEDSKNNINDLVGIVYSRIMNIIGEPVSLEISDTKPKIIFIIGPTGVGKTTTVAKITAQFSLNMQKKVGLITADTYRIAAVEQLKTYAEILNTPIEVIYSSDELLETLEKMEDRDIIFIDTAGRSHKNMEQFQELEHLLDLVEKKEVFLVLSITTKYKDIVNILNRYSSVLDYRIIFTKTDETTALGTILNIRYLTGKPLSYITFGQNVPDDIELMNPEKVTKALLGSMDK